MTTMVRDHFPFPTAGLMLAMAIFAWAQPQQVPNMGQQITPLAPQGAQFQALNPGLPDRPDLQAEQAVTTVVSPDHSTLLILTSGFNRVYTLGTPAGPTPWYGPDSNEYVFIYDISTPTPIKKQVVQIANTYNGIVFDPSGKAFYVAGGPSDNVHIFTLSAATSSADASWVEAPGSALPLGHNNLGGASI